MRWALDLLGDAATLAAGQVEALLLVDEAALLLGQQLAALVRGAHLGGDVAVEEDVGLLELDLLK